MASATATLTVNAHPNGVDNTQRRTFAFGVCALSASGTYSTNGVPLVWTAMKNVDGGSFNPLTSATQPQDAFFYSGSGATGYSYIFDKVHNTLRIWNGGTELANNAAITVDTINFCAEWVRGV